MARRTAMYTLLTTFASVSASTLSISKRALQSDAQCSSGFEWAENEAGMTPCQLSAYASGACAGGDWTTPQLSSGQSYVIEKEKANGCTCSWVNYNLLQACAQCQGVSPRSWAYYTQSGNCTGFIMEDEAFPPEVQIQGNVGFPSWAGTNPSTWAYGNFDVDQAKELASSGNADLHYPQPQSNDGGSAPVGAIAGGVVGGVLVLLLGGIVAFLIHRRRKASGKSSIFSRSHKRKISDMSFASDSDGLVSQTYNNSSGFHSRTPSDLPLMTGTTFRTTPTIRTHSASVNSLSQFGVRSTYTGSPPPAEAVASIVEPFTMPQPMSPVSPKSASAASHYFSMNHHNSSTHAHNTSAGSAYEASIAPSSRGAEDSGQPASRRRVNPPAYSPYPPGEEPATPPGVMIPPPVTGSGNSRPPVTEKGGGMQGMSRTQLETVPASPVPEYATPATPAPTHRVTTPPPVHRPTTPSSDDHIPIA